MTQDELIIWMLRVVLIGDLLALATFIVVYSRLAPWWRSRMGRTIVIKDILLALALFPSVLSLFFEFNRLTSRIAAWCDIGILALIAVVMVWRTVVWRHIDHENETR